MTLLLDSPPQTRRPEAAGRILLHELLDSSREIDLHDLPLGSQDPTHLLVAPGEFTHGEDALELAKMAGYDLLPFQAQGIIDKLGFNVIERRDGRLVERWAATETCDVVSRRNGKSVEIEVLILVGLFLLGETQIMYTAHRDDTAKAVFERVVAAIKRTPELWNELVDSGPRYGNGQREIRLKTGAVCYFRTRTFDTARGEGFNRLILDEAQNLTLAHMAAIMPVISGEPNSQLNYAGSAGGLHSEVLAKVWRSYERHERSLTYRGWHASEADNPEDVAVVARVNPRLGYGLEYERIAKEHGRMTALDFGRERLGRATYPREGGKAWVIPSEAWNTAEDKDSQPTGPLCIVPEADPELEAGSIGVAGRRDDGAMHVEVIDHEPGVIWMRDRLASLAAEHAAQIWVDPKGPVGFLIEQLRDDGVKVREFDAGDVTASFSWFHRAAHPRPAPGAAPTDPDPTPGVFHTGGRRLTQALATAQVRKVLDRLAWQRWGETNQGPLVAVTLAARAVVRGERRQAPAPPGRPVKASTSETTSASGRPRRYRTPPGGSRRATSASEVDDLQF